MQAVILAAGRGQRLGKLGERMPKCLLEVAGVPLIEHVAEALSESGEVDEILVVVAPGAIAAVEVVERAARGVPVSGVVDERPHGELASLALAADALRPRFIVSDSNILYEASLIERLLEVDRTYSPFATAAVTRRRSEARTHANLRLHGALLWPPDHVTADPRGASLRVYTGVGIVREDILNCGAPGDNLDDVLADSVLRGRRLAAADYEGFYGHVATPFCLGRNRVRLTEAEERQQREGARI